MAKHKTQLTFFSFTINGSGFVIPLKHVEGVTPIADIVLVPNNPSRVFRGLTYVMGQIVAVIDFSPLVNKGRTDAASDLLVLRHHNAFYGILINSVGTIISEPEMQRSKNRYGGVIISRVRAGKAVFDVIGVNTLIEKHVLCN